MYLDLETLRDEVEMDKDNIDEECDRLRKEL